MCGINVCPTCGKILSHIVTRQTRNTILSHFVNVVHIWPTLYHVLIRSHMLGCEHFFNMHIFIRQPACEPRVSRHVVAHLRYVLRALVTRPSFAGVPHTLLISEDLHNYFHFDNYHYG